MAVRDSSAKTFAPRGAAANARHVRRDPGIVYQDEAFRIEIELVLEPVFAPLQDIRAVWPVRMGGLFLNVRPQRSSKVHSVARLARTLRSTKSRASNSLIIKSGVSAISPRRSSRCGSSLVRRGWPCLRAPRSPHSRATHL